tara:strand:- start:398 stop:592 length:195 start_codon:yes stop_codon:yes gene_type:complete
LGDGESDISPPASATSGLASSGSVVCLAFGVVATSAGDSDATAAAACIASSATMNASSNALTAI